jgi:hypothetical protein
VHCLSDGRWQSISAGSTIDRHAIGQLVSYRDALLTITTRSDPRTRTTVHRVSRWSNGMWRQVGRSFSARSGIVALGRTGTSPLSPDLVVESTGVMPPTREVYRLTEGRWERVGRPINDAAIGPNVSGPVSREGTTWVAVNEADREPWRFSVVSRTRRPTAHWRRRVLNIGRGNAQGAVFPGHGGVWAIWTESLPTKDAAVPFNERVWAARVDRRDAAILLHAGPSVGPGDLAVVEGAGATWALSMQTTRNLGMRAHIRRLPDHAGR